MRHTFAGWFFTVTGVLACPCHLVFTLPLAVALLSGTALGGWMATHAGAIAVGAGIYFVGALVLGMTLLGMRHVDQPERSYARPAAQSQHTTDRGGSQAQPLADGVAACCVLDRCLPGDVDPAMSRSVSAGQHMRSEPTSAATTTGQPERGA